MSRVLPWILTLGALALGCGSRGAVTVIISPPSNSALNPITDRVSEYALERMDGTVLAVASENPTSPDTLPLGALETLPAPVDLVLKVLSGADLLGMARIRDVAILRGVQNQYVAQ